MNNPHQAALALQFDPSPTFANFIIEANAEAMGALHSLIAEPIAAFLSLWGPEGSGKSHLLQALCTQARAQGRSTAWLPLDELVLTQPPASVQGLGTLGLLTLDGLEAVQGRPEWQEALYALYNEVRQFGGILVSASRQNPEHLQLSLADLHSRLNWGPKYRLTPLSDAAKAKALQQRAQERGLELPDESLHFLQNRYSRNLGDLMRLLERLDQASLEQRRRLTLPFVRQWLLEQAPDLLTRTASEV